VEGPDTSDEIHRQVYLQGFAKPLLGTLLPRSYQSFFLDVTCYGIASPTQHHHTVHCHRLFLEGDFLKPYLSIYPVS